MAGVLQPRRLRVRPGTQCVCLPCGQIAHALPVSSTRDAFYPYRASRSDCSRCDLKAQCTTATSRKVTRDIDEDVRDHVRALAHTEAFQRSRRERKKVEMRFAPHETHSSARPASTAGLERCKGRGPAHRNCTEPTAPRQVALPSTFSKCLCGVVSASSVNAEVPRSRKRLGDRTKLTTNLSAKAPCFATQSEVLPPRPPVTAGAVVDPKRSSLSYRFAVQNTPEGLLNHIVGAGG